MTHIAPDDIGNLLGEEGAQDNVRGMGQDGGHHGFVGDGQLGGDTLTSQVGQVGRHTLRERVDSRDEEQDAPLANLLWQGRQVDEGAGRGDGHCVCGRRWEGRREEEGGGWRVVVTRAWVVVVVEADGVVLLTRGCVVCVRVYVEHSLAGASTRRRVYRWWWWWWWRRCVCGCVGWTEKTTRWD